jgi:hypothetical protein
MRNGDAQPRLRRLHATPIDEPVNEGGLIEAVGAGFYAKWYWDRTARHGVQTRQQLGIQALSIANQGAGAVLTLFRSNRISQPSSPPKQGDERAGVN